MVRPPKRTISPCKSTFPWKISDCNSALSSAGEGTVLPEPTVSQLGSQFLLRQPRDQRIGLMKSVEVFEDELCQWAKCAAWTSTVGSCPSSTIRFCFSRDCATWRTSAGFQPVRADRPAGVASPAHFAASSSRASGSPRSRTLNDSSVSGSPDRNLEGALSITPPPPMVVAGEIAG